MHRGRRETRAPHRREKRRVHGVRAGVVEELVAASAVARMAGDEHGDAGGGGGARHGISEAGWTGGALWRRPGAAIMPHQPAHDRPP
jgi:hypothetical protein